MARHVLRLRGRRERAKVTSVIVDLRGRRVHPGQAAHRGRGRREVRRRGDPVGDKVGRRVQGAAVGRRRGRAGLRVRLVGGAAVGVV